MQRKLTGTTIKWIAILAMIIDHIAWAYVPSESLAGMLMHTIGKTTGPIMFYFIAEGCHYTENIKKYAARLLIFAIISEIPFLMFLKAISIQNFYLNVMATLLCSLLAIYSYEKINNFILKTLIITVLIVATLWCDWAIYGIFMALCFGVFYNQPVKKWTGYALVNAVIIIMTASQYPQNSIYYLVPVIISPLLVFILISLYNGKRGGNNISKWAFYVIYPLHLLLLAVIK